MPFSLGSIIIPALLAAAAVSFFAKIPYARALVLEGATILALIPASCCFALVWIVLIGGALAGDLFGALLGGHSDMTTQAANTGAFFLVLLPLIALGIVRALVTWLAYPRVFRDLPRKRGYAVSFATVTAYVLWPLAVAALR